MYKCHLAPTPPITLKETTAHLKQLRLYLRGFICAVVHTDAFSCVLVFGWEVIHDEAVSPHPREDSAPSLPPLSFYRKLIGSCR